MNWQKGRSKETESLQKMKIWSKWGSDCYLLKFKEGTDIKEHLDIVEGKKHYRLNITLWGDWIFFKGISGDIKRAGSFDFFRPDIIKHSGYIRKNSLVLSLGVAI